jgi:hypothetical protein
MLFSPLVGLYVGLYVVVGEAYCAATEFTDYGWMDGLFILLSGPSSGFVVPGGPSVILIDFSPAFKNKLKINFCDVATTVARIHMKILLKFGYKLNSIFFFF